MKKAFTCILILLCVALLAVPAWATPGADSVRTDVVVDADGGCLVTMRFQLRLQQEEKLEIPLPLNAENVRLNGKYRTPTQQGSRMVLALPKMGAGVHTVEVSYRLPSVVTEKSGALLLDVPLLTGFGYPVDQFSFSISFPSDVTQNPSFTSGYYGESILASMDFTMQGNTIYGNCREKLKDHETLNLTYRSDKTMFPRYVSKQPLLDFWESVMALLMVSAAVYYLLALLPIIPRKIRSFSPPEGLSAGDLGTCLTGCGMDLTMMVFSWAQMGYLSMELDRQRRVYLYKRMEMGSERPNMERRCFDILFRQGNRVDGMGMHYAVLCRKMATKSALLKQIYRSHTGNPRIVRVLSVAAGACSGVLLSRGIYTAGVGTVFLALGLVIACGALSWGIQSGSKCLPLGNKMPIWMGFGCGVLWLGLGFLMNDLMLAALMVGYELCAGLLAAVGGRRSEEGQHYVAQIRGLRSHLTRVSVFDMQQCLERNPAYFFDLMPYALALGVEKPFARRFGKVQIAECSYLTAPVRGELTPAQWASILRQVADLLNRRQRRLRYEQLFNQSEQMEHRRRKWTVDS